MAVLGVVGSWMLTYHELAGSAGGPIVFGSHGISVVALAFPLVSTCSGVRAKRMSLAAPFGGLPTPHCPLWMWLIDVVLGCMPLIVTTTCRFGCPPGKVNDVSAVPVAVLGEMAFTGEVTLCGSPMPLAMLCCVDPFGPAVVVGVKASTALCPFCRSRASCALAS